MAKVNLVNFLIFRKKKVSLLEDKKLSADDFANYTSGFLTKYHLKPATKANNRDQVIINYLIWVSFIERKIMHEENLIEMGLGSKENLIYAIKIYIKRRDKMVFRLIEELKEKPKQINLISPNIAEIILKDEILLYCSKEVLDEMKMEVSTFTKALEPIYTQRFVLPFL